MQTRSQTKALKRDILSAKYEVNIDFDFASTCWRKNKVDTGNGHYKYICSVLKKDLKMCGKSCYKNLDCCWTHRKLANK